MVVVVVIDSIFSKNRVLEEQKMIQQEGQYVAIATEYVRLNLSLPCLARSQLKSSGGAGPADFLTTSMEAGDF